MVAAPDMPLACVDRTEVTNQAYADFLAAAGNQLDQQPEKCRWNLSYVPTDSWPFVQGNERHPVHSIDQCDAIAYCRWAGSRLCTKDEWIAACSNDGERTYPYGGTYDASKCNGEGASTLSPVQSFAACSGGYPGLFDMSGNASEWVFDCVDGMGASGSNDSCGVMGGAAGSAESELACAPGEDDRRSRTAILRGFRCCR
jgi:formylglycine-generating enzyme